MCIRDRSRTSSQRIARSLYHEAMGRWSWALPLLALAGCDIYGDDDSYDPPPPDEEQPVAHDDSITVAEDAYDISLTETLTANDRNPGQINQVTPAAHGTATADGWGGVH